MKSVARDLLFSPLLRFEIRSCYNASDDDCSPCDDADGDNDDADGHGGNDLAILSFVVPFASRAIR